MGQWWGMVLPLKCFGEIVLNLHSQLCWEMFPIKVFPHFVKAGSWANGLFRATAQTLFFKRIHVQAEGLVRILEQVKFQLTGKPTFSLTKACLPGSHVSQLCSSLPEQCWLETVGHTCSSSYSRGENWKTLESKSLKTVPATYQDTI